MARKDRTFASRRFRNNVATVIAAALVLIIAAPTGASAGYSISAKGKTIETACYWIEKSRLYLCEGGESLPLSEVSAITPGRFSPLEEEMNLDARRRFWTYAAWLLDRESDLKALDKSDVEGLEEIKQLKASHTDKHELRKIKEKGHERIVRIYAGVAYLERSWSDIRIPDRSLIKLSDIKILQMITWLQSLDERRMFLKTDDPTYYEYTLEHVKQAGSFQESFSRTLSDHE